MRKAVLKLAVSCAVCVALAAAPPAWAQLGPDLRGYDAVPNKATPAQNAGILLEGASTPGAGSWTGGLLFDYTHGVMGLKSGQDGRLGDLIPYRLSANALFAYQLHRRVELGVDLPFTFLQGSNFQLLREQGFPAADVSAVGLGDVRLLPRFTLLHPTEFPVGVGLVLETRLPTGNARSFLGERSFLFAPRATLDVPLGPVRVLGSLGVRLREPAQFLQLYVGNEATFGGGVIVPLPDVGSLTDVSAVGEMHLSTLLEEPFTFENADSLRTPWQVLGGVRARVAGPWNVQLSVGRGVTLEPQYGREALRVLASVRYERVMSDRDGDGIDDARDGCPDVPEDKDGFEDSDGCPDPDNDADGVPDGEDACPVVPGPRELDGCPDTDGDEVPDNVDKCPELPGPPENDGCEFEDGPTVEVESDRLRIKGNIQFETARADIRRESFKMLDDVATVLKKNPTLGPVVIEGHTDNVGSRSYNQNLSERRARAVLDYLVKKGVAAQRLRSAGFGEDKPVADNKTALGRAKNRRVDFRLVQKGAAGEAPEGSGAK